MELEKGKKVLPEFVAIPTRNWVVEEIKNCNNKSITEIETQLQKLTQREDLKDALLLNIESSRTIEFYGAAKKLDEEQKIKLAEAEEKMAEAQSIIMKYESSLRDQYSQTADVKSETKMIEWFIFNFSFYEDEVEGKTDVFPVFEGASFDEKRQSFLYLSEDKEDIEDENILLIKDIFDSSFDKLTKVINLWYNKMGNNQKEIDKSMKEVFSS